MSSLIIMGAGRIGKMVYDEIILGGNIEYDEVFYYDNDTGKQGTLINNVAVLTYDDFMNKTKSSQCDIILATDFWKELLRLCINLKIEDNITGIYTGTSFYSNPYVKRIYAQDAEELYLLEKISVEYGQDYKGFYVDIGAHHPYRLSNTHWAYMRGWRGINIEPNADAIELFMKVRDKDINVNCGIGYEEKIMKYYKFEDSSFNTFDEGEFEGLRVPKEVIDVPVMKLETILDQYKVDKIDFLDIDVEGLEMQVLQSNNWQKYKPAFILIEQKRIFVSELIETEIYQYLKKLGYECDWKGIRTAIYRLV